MLKLILKAVSLIKSLWQMLTKEQAINIPLTIEKVSDLGETYLDQAGAPPLEGETPKQSRFKRLIKWRQKRK